MLILINGDSGLIRTRRIWVLHTLAFPLGYRVIYVNRFPGLYLEVCCLLTDLGRVVWELNPLCDEYAHTHHTTT